jgi:hypothetical protein
MPSVRPRTAMPLDRVGVGATQADGAIAHVATAATVYTSPR